MQFRRLAKESVLIGGCRFNQVMTNSFKINSDIDQELPLQEEKAGIVWQDMGERVTTQLLRSAHIGAFIVRF